MLRKLTRKRALLVASIAAMAIAAVAFAFFSTSGSGSGTGTTADAPPAVTVNQTSTVSGLYPGATPVALFGNFSNSASGAQVTHVNSVTATVAVDQTHADAGCDADWYDISGTADNSGAGFNVPTGDNVGSWSGLSIQLTEANVDQSDCAGATVTITYGTT